MYPGAGLRTAANNLARVVAGRSGGLRIFASRPRGSTARQGQGLKRKRLGHLSRPYNGGEFRMLTSRLGELKTQLSRHTEEYFTTSNWTELCVCVCVCGVSETSN